MRLSTQKSIDLLRKTIPNDSPRNYGRVMKIEKDRIVLTDGFKLMFFKSDDLVNEEERTVNKYGQESSVKYPNYQGVIPKGDFINCNEHALFLDTLLTTLKPLKNKNQLDNHAVLSWENDEFILRKQDKFDRTLNSYEVNQINKERNYNPTFNPYLLIDYIKALPAYFELSDIKIYVEHGVMILTFTHPKLTDSYEIICCSLKVR